MESRVPSDVWVGRERELEVLLQAVEGLGRDLGSVVWVEGEPGIGKSALVEKAVEAARAAGYDVLAGVADPISQRSPLHVMLDLLRVSPRSPDPRRREIAAQLSGRSFGELTTADVSGADVELLVGLVDELCTAAPRVIVVDDLQYLDESSLLVLHRLVAEAEQQPLLLLGTVRPAPPRREVQRLRTVLERHDHPVLVLEPLTESDAAELLSALVGELSVAARNRLGALALGNPLYLRELADAARRDGAVRDGRRLPTSFAEALTGRLRVVPESVVDVVRMAALLGARFTVSELVVLMNRPATELVPALQDALAAGILVDAGGQMAFRHPLIRQALYDGMPSALRAALHREAARAFADSGGGALRVAEQLMASAEPGDTWARQWLVQNATAIAAHAPDIVIELLGREVERGAADEQSGLLRVMMAWVLLGVGRYEEAVVRARQGLLAAVHHAHRAEMYFVLVRALFSLGRGVEAVDAVRRALSRTDLAVVWRARLLVLLAMYRRASEGDIDAAEETARQALQIGESVQDTFATAYALTVLWANHSVRRDHDAALESLDQALDVLNNGPDHTDVRAFAQDARIFTLQNLAKWQEAAALLRQEREVGVHRALSTRLGVTAAVLFYWLGDWDDALAELDADRLDPTGFSYAGLREPGPALLWHGVGALIAARRNEHDLAVRRLREGAALPINTVGGRENRDVLVAASCVIMEQNGDLDGPVAAYAEMVLGRVPGEMTLTHQWLPDLVRLALDAGATEVVRDALEQCQAEAAAESRPGRAAVAALRCRGLADRDPVLLQAAVARYQEVGPAIELAATQEDLAVVLAARGDHTAAREALQEAIAQYTEFGAEWDVRRADRRLREYGIRRGVRGPRERRDASGWASLTSTEMHIAELVADGRSTPSIAASLVLSPRTVQTHISHILDKLGVRGRVEIAREVFRRRADRA
jgi:DNA-binding NarL/FixJ family response regulator